MPRKASRYRPRPAIPHFRKRVFDEERGRARYNRFRVKLRRAGLRVRTRGGFYGFTDEEARPARRTRAGQMAAALTSPFASGDLGLRLTSLFSSGAKRDAVLESVLHVDAGRFTLSADADGWQKLVFDVVGVVFGENGQVVAELSRTETMRVRGDALKYVVENGFVYKMRVPLKKPGAYQLRVAVRDAATERAGSASQFVEVPDLKKNRLALSSILLTTAPGAAAAAEARDPLREAAVRRFRQGRPVDFSYHIYNAKPDKATGRPRLQTQTRLFSDGRLVFEGRPVPFDPAGQTDAGRLRAGTRLTFGRDLAPGEYASRSSSPTRSPAANTPSPRSGSISRSSSR